MRRRGEGEKRSKVRGERGQRRREGERMNGGKGIGCTGNGLGDGDCPPLSGWLGQRVHGATALVFWIIDS